MVSLCSSMLALELTYGVLFRLVLKCILSNSIGSYYVMDADAFDAADVPLLFAVRYLVREYRNCVTTLQSMLDENRDLFVPLPNDHPVALGVPLPHSLLAPHRIFCDAVRAAIAAIEGLVECLDAWADDIERTLRDAVRQTRRMLQSRSNPY